MRQEEGEAGRGERTGDGEGEEKEEEFLLVFLVIYSTAELHAQAYTFLS